MSGTTDEGCHWSLRGREAVDEQSRGRKKKPYTMFLGRVLSTSSSLKLGLSWMYLGLSVLIVGYVSKNGNSSDMLIGSLGPGPFFCIICFFICTVQSYKPGQLDTFFFFSLWPALQLTSISLPIIFSKMAALIWPTEARMSSPSWLIVLLLFEWHFLFKHSFNEMLSLKLMKIMT